MIDHVVLSLKDAEAGKSQMARPAAMRSPGPWDVPSFTSPKIRHFLNNLGRRSDLHYLEIGVHKGGTFVAANYENSMRSSIAVDNWSEFAQGGDSRQQFLDNTKKLLRPGSYSFLEMDCFQMTKEHLPSPVNLYLYDGNHSYEAQKKALTHFYDLLADEFIFLVDDYAWDEVHRGTRDAIAAMGVQVLYEHELYDGWWNGFYVGVLKKTK